MKNLILIFSILFMGLSATAASPESETIHRRGYDGSAYIFVEGDVEFSVFPDGQFDFVYIGPQKTSQVTIRSRNVNVSFNSGYNYDAYVQYDDYGAVIQVESVPIYYDEFGRIAQAGNVDILYNDRRIVRVGGLNVFYNNHGYFSHVNGAINIYNPYYVYRPWHVYYTRPIYSHCIVYDMPYRRYYSPVRYSYHNHVIYYRNRNNVAYSNARRDFYRPGSRVYDNRGRSSINKDYNPNRTNTMVASYNTRNSSSLRNNTTNRNNEALTSKTRSNTTIRNNGTNNKVAVVRDRGSQNSGSSSVRNNLASERNHDPVQSSETRNSVEQTNSGMNIIDTRNQSRGRSNNQRVISNNQMNKGRSKTLTANNGTSMRQATVRTTRGTREQNTQMAQRSSTTIKSSAPSRSRSNTNSIRRNSSRESSGSRGRG